MKKFTIQKKPAGGHRLQENILLICLSYGFTGVNFIISSIFENNLNDAHYKMSIILGIVMLCMVPISYFDTRKEMRGKLNVIGCCVMHFALSLWISWLHLSWRTMILYAIEVAVAISVILLKRARNQKSDPK